VAFDEGDRSVSQSISPSHSTHRWNSGLEPASRIFCASNTGACDFEVSQRMITIQAIFHGAVQGVGFRATAKMLADRLGLMGYVRNLKDGAVEVVVQGPKQKIDQLIDQLKSRFQIIEVDVMQKENGSSYSEFTIS
jgi:acylphosphatase